MTLDLIAAQDPDTPLRAILHPFDFYDLALAFEDKGAPLPWEQVLALETCGQVMELLGVEV